VSKGNIKPTICLIIKQILGDSPGTLRVGIFIFITLMLVACSDQPWNNPHKTEDEKKTIYYASFAERPKTLDPARSYSSNEALFTAQIYEPPLQYSYLERPYRLETLTATELPKPRYYDKNGNELKADAPAQKVALSVYEIHIQQGINYQPHPAFAKDKNGHYVYHRLSEEEIEDMEELAEFKQVSTRELTAEDYVYQIKRLAHPELQSPIFGLMSQYILGLDEYSKTLQMAYENQEEGAFLNLKDYPLKGVEAVDRYTYRITIKGKYPQFIYWLAMPFFAPMPWEADAFYSQSGMEENNLTLDWYPVGTGPFQLTENNPNRRMLLKKNPNFRGERYPTQGESGDQQAGYLKHAGEPIPFIDEFIFSLEKESIPRWNKFLQGYYDQSTITADSFDEAIIIDKYGMPYLTDTMREKDIRLQTSISPSIFYIGFNMMDDIVGKKGERARKLRQAISIVLDYEEYSSIFLNGRGMPAQGPLPPGIFGYLPSQEGMNSYVYDWRNGKANRKSVAEAKHLLAEAGYPNGRDAVTGKLLVLHFDAAATGGPDDKARFSWMRKEFEKLGIQLQIRSTQYNRFQEKMRTGNAQIFSWGWHADYPDPENFLFLLYGPNGKVKYGGENAANYSNPHYDVLFEKMKNMPSGPERLAIIQEMLALVRKDSPWVWGFHPKTFSLSHAWLSDNKPHAMANNTLKYIYLNPIKRMSERIAWNKPIVWPVFIVIVLFIILLLPVVWRFWRKEHQPPL